MLGTLAGRARDARNRRILGDDVAVQVMAGLDPRTRQLAESELGVTDDAATSVALRARMIDDRVRACLQRAPDAVVLHLGCGLATRYERLAPAESVTWFDVDQPPVIALRAHLLGGDTPTHRLVAGDVVDPRILDGVPTGRPTLLVAEGLTMYLTPETGGALLARVVDRFGGSAGPNGMVFDVFSRLGIRLQVVNSVVRRSGSRLEWGVDDPRALERLGLRLEEDLTVSDMLDVGAPYVSEHAADLYRRLVRFGPMRRMARILRYSF